MNFLYDDVKKPYSIFVPSPSKTNKHVHHGGKKMLLMFPHNSLRISLKRYFQNETTYGHENHTSMTAV